VSIAVLHLCCSSLTEYIIGLPVMLFEMIS
jgi:hypothetical protein